MSDLTFNRADFFPPGTALSLWPKALVGPARLLKQEPPLTATDTATVGSDGAVTFAAAVHQVSYVAGGLVTPVPAAVDVEGATDTWTVTVAATGGTFTLAFDAADDTDPVAFDATSNAVKTAVDAALTVTDTEVTGDAGGPWTIVLATPAAITADGALLSAASDWRFLQCNTGHYVAPDSIPHPYGS